MCTEIFIESLQDQSRKHGYFPLEWKNVISLSNLLSHLFNKSTCQLRDVEEYLSFKSVFRAMSKKMISKIKIRTIMKIKVSSLGVRGRISVSNASGLIYFCRFLINSLSSKDTKLSIKSWEICPTSARQSVTIQMSYCKNGFKKYLRKESTVKSYLIRTGLICFSLLRSLSIRLKRRKSQLLNSTNLITVKKLL